MCARPVWHVGAVPARDVGLGRHEGTRRAGDAPRRPPPPPCPAISWPNVIGTVRDPALGPFVPVVDVQIGPADRGAVHPHEHLVLTRRRDRDLDQLGPGTTCRLPQGPHHLGHGAKTTLPFVGTPRQPEDVCTSRPPTGRTSRDRQDVHRRRRRIALPVRLCGPRTWRAGGRTRDGHGRPRNPAVRPPPAGGVSGWLHADRLPTREPALLLLVRGWIGRDTGSSGRDLPRPGPALDPTTRPDRRRGVDRSWRRRSTPVSPTRTT